MVIFRSQIGREVLDLAGQAVAVGVTTEHLDVVVHEVRIFSVFESFLSISIVYMSTSP